MAKVPHLVRKGLREKTVMSRCGKYRYCLWRRWSASNDRYVVFVGLNPSTANAKKDDPTIRRCIAFAKKWRCGALCMVNLFAARTPKPAELRKAAKPIGSLNDTFLRALMSRASRVVACWGNHGNFLNRDLHVRRMIRNGRCFGLTKAKAPRHPLYVPYSQKLCKF